MKNAREFLFAIRETIPNEIANPALLDEQAEDYLENLRRALSARLTAQAATEEARDAVCFFEGMLKGVQLQLTRKKIESRAELQRMGLWGPDGARKDQ